METKIQFVQADIKPIQRMGGAGYDWYGLIEQFLSSKVTSARVDQIVFKDFKTKSKNPLVNLHHHLYNSIKNGEFKGVKPVIRSKEGAVYLAKVEG